MVKGNGQHGNSCICTIHSTIEYRCQVSFISPYFGKKWQSFQWRETYFFSVIFPFFIPFFLACLSPPVCQHCYLHAFSSAPSPRYLTCPLHSSLSSPAPRPLISVSCLSLCSPFSPWPFVAFVGLMFCACLLVSPVSLWYVFFFFYCEFWFFHVWFVLCLFLCTLLNCFILLLCLAVSLLLCFVVFGISCSLVFCCNLCLNKNSSFVLSQSCLLSCK